MKKFFYVAALAIVVAACCKPQGYKVDGKLEGFDDQKVYLYVGNSNTPTDSVDMVGGVFSFTSKEAYPDMGTLVFEKSQARPTFIIEKGTILVTGTAENIVIGGTPANDQNQQFTLQIQAVQDQYSEFIPRLRELYVKKDRTDAENVELDALMAKSDSLSNVGSALTNDFVKANPTSLLSAYIVGNSQNTNTVGEIDSLLSLVASVEPNAFVDHLKERREVLAAVADGQPAPDFTLPTVAGTDFTLSSLKGKVVVVDFWASWCGPCRGENPNMVKLYKEFKDKGLEVVSVSVDTDEAAWKKAVEEDGMTWTQCRNVNSTDKSVKSTANVYGVTFIPHIVLIDQEGKIVATGLVGEELKAKVQELLTNTAAKTTSDATEVAETKTEESAK